RQLMDKAAFFDALRLQRRTVQVPGTELEMVLQELSAADQAEVFKQCAGKGPHEVAAVAVCISCPDLDLDDAPRLLNEVNAAALMKLSEQVFEFSGITDDAVDDAKKD
ncbi:MAG: hypothetical protein AAF756_20550, partial [Pseudomonadota bacterium]